MTTIELKRHLIERITDIDDEKFLNAIKTILDSKLESKILNLTEEQRLEITESRRQIEQGLFIEQLEVDEKFAKWLEGR